MSAQKVLVSVDVEAPVGENGVDNLIYGKINSSEYGIKHIMDILDDYQSKGLFFVDIAEAWEYGEKVIVDVLKYIDDRGHMVGVHLHPDRMADKNRRFLWQYTYDEQFSLIMQCTDFYVNALGKKPVSFRAGRYGANNDTIKILNLLGYRIDMSMYYGMKKRCRIDGEYETINRLKLMDTVIEAPVTVFKSFDFGGYTRFDKIDESMPLAEFKYVLSRNEKENSVDVISFFMHSFSFLDWRANPDSPSFSEKSDTRIRKMLNEINNRNYEFIGENELLDKTEFIDDKIILNTSRGIYALYFDVIRAFKIIKEKVVRDI